nr:hypothetical protein [Candidatus Woesebacteria bacterium]
MKVFYSATYQGEQEFGKFYSAIYKEIEQLGYENVDDDVVELTYDSYVAEMSKGRESQVSNYHKKMDGIQKADICVIEVSVHSLGTGFLVQKALEMAKPVIVLYYKNNTPFFLNGIDDDKLIIRSYDDENYKKVLRETFAIAREKRDKRFNFFLSPKLLNYIEDASNARGITKSKLLRDMIVNHMREN